MRRRKRYCNACGVFTQCDEHTYNEPSDKCLLSPKVVTVLHIKTNRGLKIWILTYISLNHLLHSLALNSLIVIPKVVS